MEGVVAIPVCKIRTLSVRSGLTLGYLRGIFAAWGCELDWLTALRVKIAFLLARPLPFRILRKLGTMSGSGNTSSGRSLVKTPSFDHIVGYCWEDFPFLAVDRLRLTWGHGRLSLEITWQEWEPENVDVSKGQRRMLAALGHAHRTILAFPGKNSGEFLVYGFRATGLKVTLFPEPAAAKAPTETEMVGLA